MSVPARPLIADWPLTVCRYFLVDGDAGDDTARGYVDAAPNTTIVPGANPKKTLAAVLAILPQAGLGRTAKIMVKTKAGAASYAEDITIRGCEGYAYLAVWGSTDLTNSVTDQIQAGARQVQTGTGGGGAFTVAAGSTTSLLNLGGGDTIPAEPAALQYRIRFDPATTTVALRNVCKVITAHTTTAVTLGSVLSVAPAIGDKFYIEGPGVTVSGLAISGVVAKAEINSTAFFNIVGIRFTTTTARGVRFENADFGAMFLECNGVTTNNVINVAGCLEVTIIHVQPCEDGTTNRTLGSGIRTSVNMLMANSFCVNLSQSGFMNTGAVSPNITAYGPSAFLGDQCYFAKGVAISTAGAESGSAPGKVFFGRSTATNQRPRIVGSNGAAGGLNISGSLTVKGLDITGCGVNACIRTQASPAGGYSITIDDCVGATSNTDVGIDISASTRLTCAFGREVANTITGNAGDIRVAGPVITTHAGLGTTNFVDTNRNSVIGTAAPTVDQCLKLNNGEAGAMAIGDLVRVSAANTVVLAQADTAAHSSGPLLVAVTPPAAGAAGLFYRPHQAWIHHDGAPTQNAISYVSVGTAGRATTTIPPLAATNQKRRLGCVVATSGNNGLVVGSADNLPVLADGLA